MDLTLASSCHSAEVYNPFNGSWDNNLFTAYLKQKETERSVDERYQSMLDTSAIVVLSAWPKDPVGAWTLDVRTTCLTAGAGLLPGSKRQIGSGSQVSGSAMLAGVLLSLVFMLAFV